MTNLQDGILLAFIDQNARQLKDTDVSIALTRKSIACSPEEVQRHVRSLSPALFQLTFNADKTVTIRVEPTIQICEDFLAAHCQPAAKSCDKLHICRHFDNCVHAKCHFPHDFAKGNNQRIVKDHNCQYIDPKLLVKLLRLQNFPRRPPPNRGIRPRRARNPKTPHRPFPYQGLPGGIPAQEDDLDRQVDVSFPSSRLDKQINMENIELHLTLRGIKVKNKLDENGNEYCRRATILLEQINDVEKLLVSPIFDLNGIDIKFKRTKQIVDKTNFILKTTINNEQDKIDSYRLELYIGTLLVDKSLIEKISDYSTDSEQIILVECKGEIDFDRVRQKNLSKPQLSGKDITLTQIYECDGLEIHSNHQNESITEDKLKRIFHTVWKDIFAYHFPAPNHAEVEFINANALKQWKPAIDRTQNKFDVRIIPIIDSVDENSSDTRSNVSREPEAKSHSTTIKLRDDWALIAGHRTFKIEYKEFIHQAFGGNVEINDDDATYTGTFPRHLDGSRSEVKFGNKTNEFMTKFRSEKFEKLNENQVQILRTSSDTVAFTRTNANDYLVATKAREMPELKRKLFEKSNPPKPSNPKVNPSVSSLTKSTSLLSLNASTSIYPITTVDRMSMFSIETFEGRLQRYLKETFHVELTCEKSNNNEKTKGPKNSIRLKITGPANDVENAIEDIDNLFSSLRTKKFDNTIDGNWTIIGDATEVINYHFKLFDMICICEQTSRTNVNVYHFDITNPQFGIDEQRILDLIKDRFRSATIPLNQQSISSKLTKDWADLEEEIRQRNDYKRKICFSKESNTIYLFGVPELIKEFRQRFEQLIHKYNPQPCKITLSERQLNFLTYVEKGNMNKLEKEYRSIGCDISSRRLRESCEFLAPLDMHSEIKDKLQALAQIRDISFDIVEPGFEILISKEPERLTSVVKSKCYLEKTIDTHRDHIPIPKARETDLDDRMKSTNGASANPNGVTSVSIGHSTMTIVTGDLTAQAVDAIVVCSSSGILCDRITRAAGTQVVKEYAALKSSDNFPNATSGGVLSCKRIIFVPWAPASRDTAVVKSSLSSFIALAFMRANSEGCKSIAFPAIGCGQFGYDSSTIARYMLRETRDQLKAVKSKMNISFVILADQINVYDAFVKCLTELESVDIKISPKVPSTKKDDQLSIPFDRKTVKITLVSSNDNDLIECKEKILKLAQLCSKTFRETKSDMLNWTQVAINKYYDYCLKQRVIPKLDLDKTILELVGSKDGVHECEKYFYQLTNEILDEQRIHALAQGVIWSVESTSNSDTWEPYSSKRNGTIEDAFSKKHAQVNFENDKGEKCQIIFSKMEEQSPSKTRRVRRVLADSILPITWQNSGQNRIRIALQPTSQEYRDVLAQFRETMETKYSEIIKIERIQNERWYKQYAAHRDEFQKRYSHANERLLFHGCKGEAADQIIEKCYNRSFAGVNGVLYGCGVYFHAQARYSHNYALANDKGERTMFLARVLIGKTCKGDSTMKVVPAGFDTTTDGQHIFVVYHDAGAYADYLITYK